MHPAIKTLFEYAACPATGYAPGTFSTSADSYAITPTEPESRVCDALAALEKEGADFLTVIPGALYAACIELAATREQVDHVGRFIGDMFANLTQQYIYEDRGFAEDQST